MLSFVKGRATISVNAPSEALFSLGGIAWVSIDMRQVRTELLRKCPNLAPRLRSHAHIRIIEDWRTKEVSIQYPTDVPSVYMAYIHEHYSEAILDYVLSMCDTVEHEEAI